MAKLTNNFQRLLLEKQLREGRRYKQIDIAEETGLSNTTVSRWARDDNIDGMLLRHVKTMADWFGVSISELVEEPVEIDE